MCLYLDLKPARAPQSNQQQNPMRALYQNDLHCEGRWGPGSGEETQEEDGKFGGKHKKTIIGEHMHDLKVKQMNKPWSLIKIDCNKELSKL